jgi:hypothetical protein
MAALAAALLWPQVGTTQEHDQSERAFELELGAAGERSLDQATSQFGAALGFEVTPIENWLEIEFGVAALRGSGHTELESELIVKKPFRLSPTVEMMLGAGPLVSRTVKDPQKGTSLGVEVVIDFQFWPYKDTGWFLEPTWSRTSHGGEQSYGLTGGLLLTWP